MDKIAIVTGAGQGIGRSIALKMAQEGADVVIAGGRGSWEYWMEFEVGIKN